jgi:hypothetical protein
MKFKKGDIVGTEYGPKCKGVVYKVESADAFGITNWFYHVYWATGEKDCYKHGSKRLRMVLAANPCTRIEWISGSHPDNNIK